MLRANGGTGGKRIRMVLAGPLLATSALAGPFAPVAMAQEASATQGEFRIAAQPLADALVEFGRQSGLEVTADPPLIAGKRSAEVTGRLAPGAALSRLLAGTGLTFRFISATGVTLERAPQASGDGAIQLGPVRVEGTGDRTVASRRFRGLAASAKTGTAEEGYLVSDISGVGPWDQRSLQDTPYSITVAPADLIENTVARDFDQIFKMNPVVQVSAPMTVFGYPSVMIRGFGQGRSIVDGVRLSNYSCGLSTEEIERVEVLNGLSGFLYGSGNVGGVANYVLKRPTYEPLANVVAGNYGDGQWFAHADLGGKIDSDGTVAYRFNAAYSDGATSKYDQHLKKWLVSGAVDFNLSDDVLFQLEAAHTYWRLDRTDTRFYSSGISYWPDAFDVEKTYTPDWTYNETKSDRIGANLRYAISDALSLRTAYLYKEDEREHIITYPIYTPTGWSLYRPGKTAPYTIRSQGAYAYLDASFDTGAISHKLTVGGSWDTNEQRQHVNNSISATTAGGEPYVPPADMTVDEFLDLPKPHFSSDYGPRYKSAEATNSNLMIGDDIRLTENLSVLAGVNYATVKSKNFDQSGQRTASYDETAWTPTLSLIFKPLSRLTTYASYMESLEPGSVVPNDPALYNNPGEILDPAISEQYEIGAKYALSDDLLLTSALFRIEKANSYDEMENGRITITQDGRQVHQGIELTLTGKVTDALTISTGGTIMDLAIEKATNPDLEGKKPVGSSTVLAKLSVEYAVPGLDGLVLSGGAYHSGKKYKDSANLQEIDGYTIFDLGARYRTEALGTPLTFALYASNLTDKDYWSSHWQLGLPRNIAFSVKAEF